MAKDNENAAGKETGQDTGDKDGGGTADKTGGGKKLTADEIKEVLIKAGLDDGALQQVYDQAGQKVLDAHLLKQKAKDDEKAKELAAKKREAEIEKLDGVEKQKAEAEETLRKANEKEQELVQRECRAVLTAKGFSDFPRGVSIESEEAAGVLAEYLSKLKPAKGGDKAPGRPEGDRSLKPKTEADEINENSNGFLAGTFPWLEKLKKKE